MKKIRLILLAVTFVAFLVDPVCGASNALPDHATLRQWIEEMKTAPRGPFARVRWFCNDGTVLPPKAYACRDHGGGRQHGEWTDQVKQLRAGGYLIANVLTDPDISKIADVPGYSEHLNQMLIERFLIATDDAWIFRKARYYRGALQAEDEVAGARNLLLGMASHDAWIKRGYLPLRVAANLLDHGVETSSVAEVRQHSLALSERDSAFLPTRVKIHNQPDRDDAGLVREYAAQVKDPSLKAEYDRLAAKIQEVYASDSVVKVLQQLQAEMRDQPELSSSLAAAVKTLQSSQDPAILFGVTARLMAEIRQQLPRIKGAERRLVAIDAGLALEAGHLTAATELKRRLGNASRREHLGWLKQSALALYGAGLISDLQRKDLLRSFEAMPGDAIPLGTYRNALDYTARVPGWGNRWMSFHFSESMQKLAEIEPLANRFIQDQLRGSPLFFYAKVLDDLQRDANQMLGLRHELFGHDVGAGLRSLNPGLARGTLQLSPGNEVEDFEAGGIYLLPETIAELPPVAGILTAGEGNPLSHVQLLARNLGIPNVVVDKSLIPGLAAYQGTRVILAASPGGAVQLMKNQGQLDQVLARIEKSESLIRPDLGKLDLKTRAFIPLRRLRASDSGRIVGPKSANLGELHHHYPDKVADGLAIPFGVFRGLLDQPVEDGKQTVFEWMVAQYTKLRPMPPGSRERAERTESFRKQLEKRVLKADPGDDFRRRLSAAMEKTFGADGTYGVFVRSDTNVEDLPGFTGAGLNKTVANVVGFESVLAAISEVWASPFSRRAFAWRQSHMDLPQHVYASVLLLRSVPVEKSGVLVTRDIDTGDAGWLSAVINEGVGGAVDGQAAESVRINMQTGEVRMLAQATAQWSKVLQPTGGVGRELTGGSGSVLQPDETKQLIELARELPSRFPPIVDADGNLAPADIEFGFLGGKLRLFQIRPFLESSQARSNQYLNGLDKGVGAHLDKPVKLNEPPK